MSLRQYWLEGSNFRGTLHEESTIAYTFANWLREQTLNGKLDFIWFHVANEVSSSKNKTFGALLKACGKFPGVADYIFLGKSQCFAIELKTLKGKLSPNQQLFKQWCQIAQVPYHTAHSFHEAKDIVESYGSSPA